MPTPRPSIGAPARVKAASASSSRPPLAKIVTRGKSARIENAAHAARQRVDIAGIEPHAADRDAGRLKPRRQRHDFAGRGLGVVGVEQQHEIVRPRLRERGKCRGLVVERLDEGMRHGAVERDAERASGLAPSRCRRSRRVACPRGHQPGLGAVRAPHAEIDQTLPGAASMHARRLGGDQHLKVQDLIRRDFDELRLRQRRGDAQDRLVGEEHRAFAHGVDVAGEAECRR